MYKDNYREKIKVNNKTIYIHIAPDDKSNIFFKDFILFYMKYQSRNGPIEKSFVGIDIEFNNLKMALFQICFFDINDCHVIFILDPLQFGSHWLDYFVENILLNDNIYKIFHGADSLDIPHIYKDLLANNKEHIINFTNKLVDTRFICEFYQNSVQYKKKCSLYYALLYYNVITQDEFNKLDENEHKIGPTYKMFWNIKTITDRQLLYAYFDVIYLKTLLYNILKKAETTTPTIFPYYTYLPKLINFSFLYKNGYTPDLEIIKTDIDKLNNYIIVNNGKNIKFIEIYNHVYENIPVIRYFVMLDYLKVTNNIIFKYIIYKILLKKYNQNIKTTNINVVSNLNLEIYKLSKLSIFMKYIIQNVIIILNIFFKETDN